MRRRISGHRRFIVLFGLLVLWPMLACQARAHEVEDQVLAQVGVDERLGAPLPLELSFSDQNGKPVRLASYFTGGPVILTLNYYSCPTLCPLVFRNLASTIGRMRGLTLGKDFRVVTVSIDPEETLARATDKSLKTYAMLVNIPQPGRAWPFLLGAQPSIDRLAQRVGVRYLRLEKEFAHPDVIIITTPDGRVARYLYGLEQEPKDLQLALIEASDGNIGGSRILNNAFLYCYHYDPVGKKYVLAASRIMTGSMVAVLLIVVGLLALLWRREKRPTG